MLLALVAVFLLLLMTVALAVREIRSDWVWWLWWVPARVTARHTAWLAAGIAIAATITWLVQLVRLLAD